MKWVLPVAFLALFACGRREETKPPPAGKAVDPVCGMDVSKEGAKFQAAHEGKEYFFCSAGCKAKFEKTPEIYRQGYCACGETMEKCKCDHCGALAANRPPDAACPCAVRPGHGH